MSAVDKPRALIVAAAVLFGGVYAYEVHQEHAHAACSDAQAKVFIQVLTARSGTSNTRQDAEDALLDGLSVLVLNPPVTPADKARADRGYRMLFGDYAKAAAAFRHTKAASPLPVFPSC